MKKAPFSIEYLKSILHYEPETGKWTWKISLSNRRLVGSKAGCIRKSTNSNTKYTTIRIDNSYYRAHVLAWFYMTGEWPERDIDHKNRIGHDNKWDNLRLCTQSQNGANQEIRTTNTSGYKGVSWDKSRQVYRAYIVKNNKQHHLGYFNDSREAAITYDKKAIELFGEYAKLNFPTSF